MVGCKKDSLKSLSNHDRSLGDLTRSRNLPLGLLAKTNWQLLLGGLIRVMFPQ